MKERGIMDKEKLIEWIDKNTVLITRIGVPIINANRLQQAITNGDFDKTKESEE